MKPTRKQAKEAGSTRYRSKLCAKHPELKGDRHTSSGTCVGCLHQNVATRREKRKSEIIEHYSNGMMCCAHCGIDDLEVLTIDHIEQNGAEHRRQVGIRGKGTDGINLRPWLKRNGYPPGYRVLCFNCNVKAWFAHQRKQRAN